MGNMNVSKSKRRPVYGVGINDSNYTTSWVDGDGDRVRCPFYTVWANMLKRCYCKKSSAKNESYIGCSVCDEWKVFSSFKSWMELQPWEGRELDKDLKIENNKVYSPSTCVFISQRLNTIISRGCKPKKLLPVGVYFEKFSGKYKAQCSDGTTNKSLGRFDSVSDAELCYLEFKVKVIKDELMFETDYTKKAMSRILRSMDDKINSLRLSRLT